MTGDANFAFYTFLVKASFDAQTNRPRNPSNGLGITWSQALENIKRYKITSSINPLNLCAWHQCPNHDQCLQLGLANPNRLGDLSQLKRDPFGIGKLRELVRQSEHGGHISLLSDDQVVEKFSHLLHTRRWRICPHVEIRKRIPAPSRVQADPEPPRVIQRQREPVPIIDEPETSQFTGNHDPSAQALALIDASAAGLPFCAECEKLRLKNAALAQQADH